MTELLANLPFDPIDYDPQPFAVFTEEALRRGTAAPRMQLIVKQTGSHTCGRHLRHRDVFLLPGLGGVLWSWLQPGGLAGGLRAQRHELLAWLAGNLQSAKPSSHSASTVVVVVAVEVSGSQACIEC